MGVSQLEPAGSMLSSAGIGVKSVAGLWRRVDVG
jgi:hypothetical protein